MFEKPDNRSTNDNTADSDTIVWLKMCRGDPEKVKNMKYLQTIERPL